MAFDREKYSNNRDWQILENLATDIWKFLRSSSKPHLKIIQDTTQICWVTISGLCWFQLAQTYVKIETENKQLPTPGKQISPVS